MYDDRQGRWKAHWLRLDGARAYARAIGMLDTVMSPTLTTCLQLLTMIVITSMYLLCFFLLTFYA